MAIPEAVAIVTSTIAIYTFLRNCVDTINADRDNWNNAEGDRKLAATQLKSAEAYMRTWHTDWMTYMEGQAEGMEAEVKEQIALLYIAHWGEEGCQHIKDCVENFQGAIDQFKPWWVDQLESGSLKKRIKHVFRNKKKLEAFEKRVNECMNMLERDSKSFFRRENPDISSEEVTRKEIHKHARDYLLVRLANSSYLHGASQGLYNSWTTTDTVDFSIHLVLDFLDTDAFKEPTIQKQEIRRNNNLPFVAHKQKFDFIFITKANGPNAWGTCMRTLVRPVNHTPANTSMSFREAATYVHKKMGRESGFASSAYGYYFVVRNDSVNDRSYSSPASTISQILGGYEFPRYFGSPMHRLKRTQAVLAYRVAECGLLLLRTPWLVLICSCRVCHRPKIPAPPAIVPEQFTFLHDDFVNCRCGLATNSGNLFRLGIFLTEILLGTPIKKVRLPLPGAAEGSQYSTNPFSPWQKYFIPNNDNDILLLQAVLNRASGSTSIGEAIAYCLRSTLTPGTITTDSLNEYRRVVLDPFRSLYTNLLRATS